MRHTHTQTHTHALTSKCIRVERAGNLKVANWNPSYHLGNGDNHISKPRWDTFSLPPSYKQSIRLYVTHVSEGCLNKCPRFLHVPAPHTFTTHHQWLFQSHSLHLLNPATFQQTPVSENKLDLERVPVLISVYLTHPKVNSRKVAKRTQRKEKENWNNEQPWFLTDSAHSQNSKLEFIPRQ